MWVALRCVAKEITPAFVCCFGDLICCRWAASGAESARVKGVIRRDNKSERGRSDGDQFQQEAYSPLFQIQIQTLDLLTLWFR
jgi:hypothetical protein